MQVERNDFNSPGAMLSDSSYDIVLREDEDVYKEDGTPLLKFRRQVLDQNVCKVAYGNLRKAAAPTGNRGTAGGVKATKRLRVDGSVSNTTGSEKKINSGIVGYFDRYQRIPYCRQTSYSLKHPERFQKAIPFFQQVSEVFRTELPERWQAQRDVIDKSSQAFYIPDTVFTTVTVNRNWQTAVHTDKGDLQEGFGCMSAFDGGMYDGCYLVFPAFRLAVDMRMGDVLLADVHEFHGSSPFKITGRYERVSCILYYRAGIKKCGTIDEEIERAKLHGAKINAEL